MATQHPSVLVQVSERRDHILGPVLAPVTLLEYGDYECPHCQQAHFIVQELMTGFRDQLRFAFRNFPLSAIHPHAEKAAEAAEAAGAQGQFWDMHDVLFENQHALEEEDLVGYAQELGLDLARFELELVQGLHAPRVREDVLSGTQAGVQGTPTFFINGRRHKGPWDLRALTEAVTVAMSSANATRHLPGHDQGPSIAGWK